MIHAVDLFAGPGGWDVAARELGLHVTGIEIDAAACATRRAAGLPTVEGDIRDHSPAEFPLAVGLIASPPCQTFSAAGKGAGRLALDTVLLELKKVAAGEAIDYAAFSDERTGLVLEPLRWIRDAFYTGGYEWVALEQVPAVLPVWEAYADALRDWGYSVDVGKLSAEQYGVPQTRKRAILVAHRYREVSLPAPTHTAYAKGKSRFTGAEDGLIPWVSMAEALGWGMTARPYPTIACSRSTGGPDKEKVGGSGGRAEIYGEMEAGRWAPGGDVWMVGAGADGAGRPRPSDEPAPTIAGGGAAAWIDDPEKWYGQDSTNPGPADSYAEGAAVTYVNGTHEKDLDEPAATLAFGHERPQWVAERPATTVQGDPRIWPPGHKVNGDDRRRLGEAEADAKYGDRAGKWSVRVSLDEAAVLQSFPAGYPWQGTKTKRFQQIGNAVPPLLARAVLAQVIA